MASAAVRITSPPLELVVRDRQRRKQAQDVVVRTAREHEQAFIKAVLLHHGRGGAVATKRGVPLIAITDSVLSPLARRAAATFTIAGEGVGPFDSQTGAMAVANTLVTAVAQRLRTSATRRLDRVEQAWRAAGVLTDS